MAKKDTEKAREVPGAAQAAHPPPPPAPAPAPAPAGLSEEDRFHRDLLMRLLGWGSVFLALMTAWLIHSASDISFATSDAPGAFHRALGLSLLAPPAWLAWFAAVHAARNRCPDHATVLPRMLVLQISLAELLAALLIVVLAVF